MSAITTAFAGWEEVAMDAGCGEEKRRPASPSPAHLYGDSIRDIFDGRCRYAPPLKQPRDDASVNAAAGGKIRETANVLVATSF